MPGVGISLLLIAVGAVLAFAVTATVSGVSLPVVGTILMIVGGIGLLLSILYMMTWASSRETTTHDHIHDV
jgi:hypothetical protein